MIVVYRACPVGSAKNRPITSNKESLIKICFDSFIDAFKGADYDLFVILDKPNQNMRRLFDGYEQEEHFFGDFTEGNIGTFHRQLDFALHSGENFLLVEDDYYWLEGAGKVIEEALRGTDGFISPYDHPDHYKNPEFNRLEGIEILGGHHFRTCVSNTLTFGGTHEMLEQEIKTMKGYGWADHPMWVDVTERVPLYSPIPSLATHMEEEWLAPVIDWPF